MTGLFPPFADCVRLLPTADVIAAETGDKAATEIGDIPVSTKYRGNMVLQRTQNSVNCALGLPSLNNQL